MNIELEQLHLQKDSLSSAMDKLIVYAEHPGTVLEVNSDDSLQGEVLLRIGSLAEIVVDGMVSEYDALKVSLGQAVILTSEAVLDKEWRGEVISISDLPSDLVQDESGAYYPIKVNVKDNMDLKPGFRMLIEVMTSQKQVTTIPINAVQQTKEENYVFIVEKGKAKQLEVEIGVANNESIEIVKGITEDDVVILNPSKEIIDGIDVDLQ